VNVFFHTFGCRANQYDTELVRLAFAETGATVVDDPTAADVAIVNSCTVTGESEAKLRRFVGRIARGREGLETVVIGCLFLSDVRSPCEIDNVWVWPAVPWMSSATMAVPAVI